MTSVNLKIISGAQYLLLVEDDVRN